MTTILKVPDIGDFSNVEIIEVLVKPGDVVAVEQSLITVESDKASMEIPATEAGRIVEMKVKLGDKVSKGSEIAVIEAAALPRPPPRHPQLLHRPPRLPRPHPPARLLHRQRVPARRPRRPPTARPMSNATCLSSAAARVVTPPRSVPLIWA